MAVFDVLPQVITACVVILVAAVVFKTFSIRQKSGTKPWLKCFLDAFCGIFISQFRIGPWSESTFPGLHQPYSSSTTGKTAHLVNSMIKGKDLTEEDKEGLRSACLQYDTALQGVRKSGVTISPFGYVVLQQSLQIRLSVRLDMLSYIRRHPEISQIPVRRPVFVIGFPRTGTTFLHELLGMYPKGSSHLLWEQISPVPLSHDESLAARTRDRLKRYNGPAWAGFQSMMMTTDEARMQRIHRLGYDLPEECTNIVGMEVPLNPPSLPYMMFAAKECMDLGAGEAFNLYKQYLQLMAWQSEHRQGDFTWILKCPFHLPYLTELHAAFPDATIVWTHRDPAECIASACSLYETLLDMSAESWTIDKHAMGRAVMEYTAHALERAGKSLSTTCQRMNITHVRYKDIIKDPKGTVKKICDKAGIDFSVEYDETLSTYLAKNASDRQKLKEQKAKEQKGNGTADTALHTYSLEEYGLSQKEVSERFGGYISQYKLRES